MNPLSDLSFSPSLHLLCIVPTQFPIIHLQYCPCPVKYWHDETLQRRAISHRQLYLPRLICSRFLSDPNPSPKVTLWHPHQTVSVGQTCEGWGPVSTQVLQIGMTRFNRHNLLTVVSLIELGTVVDGLLLFQEFWNHNLSFLLGEL